MKRIETFMKGKNEILSLLNVNIKNYLTDSDYFYLLITDIYKFKLHKIAEDYIGDEEYYFYIIWINDIKTLADIDSGITIKIPTLKFIKRYKNEMKTERGNE